MQAKYLTFLLVAVCDGFTSTVPKRALSSRSASLTRAPVSSARVRNALLAAEGGDDESSGEDNVNKYGLEVGLFKALRSDKSGKEKTVDAKALLKRYGSAYLVTSITLALISFGICYGLIDNGVDVASLLQKVGIDPGASGEKAGTAAIAYAVHKAASPIRFPPTVALTPVVAGWLGKDEAPAEEEEEEEAEAK